MKMKYLNLLCFSESGKVSHYIINSIGTGYKIGENTFPDLHSIIEFYKNHFLDSTNLTEPVSKARVCYIAEYNANTIKPLLRDIYVHLFQRNETRIHITMIII